MPRNPIQVTNAFSNDPNDRPYQDVGFDGLTDSAEVTKRRADYLNVLQANFGVGSKAYQDALQILLQITTIIIAATILMQKMQVSSAVIKILITPRVILR